MDHLDAPPSYPPSVNVVTPAVRDESGTRPSNQIFEENEVGEMQPVNVRLGDSPPNEQPEVQQVPATTIYTEDKYGEMHREEADPDLVRHHAVTTEERPAKDTKERSDAFRSDEIYPENRFGELGRADSFAVVHEHENITDKIKGMAGHVVDKLTIHHHNHDPRHYDQREGEALKPIESNRIPIENDTVHSK